MWMLAAVLACGGDDTYILDGTVVDVESGAVRVDHAEVTGVVPQATSEFRVEDPALLRDLTPGDRILGRFDMTGEGPVMRKVRVVGSEVPPQH